MPTAPQTTLNFTDIPADQLERQKYLSEIFGQHLFWMRNQRLDVLRRLICDANFREDKLGTIQRRPFDAMGECGPDACEAAVGVVKAALDLYLQDILALLTAIGGDMRLGPKHSVKYKLVMEVVETDSDHTVIEETVNRLRGHNSALFRQFGRWLNTYKLHGAAKDKTAGEGTGGTTSP